MKRSAVLLVAVLISLPAWAAKKRPYSYFRVGNANDVSTTVSGYFAMLR